MFPLRLAGGCFRVRGVDRPSERLSRRRPPRRGRAGRDTARRRRKPRTGRDSAGDAQAEAPARAAETFRRTTGPHRRRPPAVFGCIARGRTYHFRNRALDWHDSRNLAMGRAWGLRACARRPGRVAAVVVLCISRGLEISQPTQGKRAALCLVVRAGNRALADGMGAKFGRDDGLSNRRRKRRSGIDRNRHRSRRHRCGCRIPRHVVFSRLGTDVSGQACCLVFRHRRPGHRCRRLRPRCS